MIVQEKLLLLSCDIRQTAGRVADLNILAELNRSRSGSGVKGFEKPQGHG